MRTYIAISIIETLNIILEFFDCSYLFMQIVLISIQAGSTFISIELFQMDDSKLKNHRKLGHFMNTK